MAAGREYGESQRCEGEERRKTERNSHWIALTESMDNVKGWYMGLYKFGQDDKERKRRKASSSFKLTGT